MPPYIYINGCPGIGKLTIAKELEKLVLNSKVYHNHLLIDPIASLVDRDSPHYHDIRTSFRRHILNTIANLKQQCNSLGSSLIRDLQTLLAVLAP